VEEGEVVAVVGEEVSPLALEQQGEVVEEVAFLPLVLRLV
jgi:hypothetical protein